MDLAFDRGSPQEPRGHALLYFEDATQPGRLLVTYLIVLPVAVDLSRYLPPMFLSQLQMGQIDFQEMSAFAFPPVPEPMEDRQHLEGLATRREDDLLLGGTLSSGDLQQGLTAVSEAVQEYARLYQEHLQQSPQEAPAALSVSQVLYELMSPRARLQELAKLLGQLRFALDGPDPRLAQEVGEEIQSLAAHFPGHYWTGALVAAARRPDPQGRRLAQLYLDRCYRLLEEEYEQAQEIEREIARLESGS